MILTKETIEKIKNIILETENNSYDDLSSDYDDEVTQGAFAIFFTYRMHADLVEAYNYHSEVSYNCYEDVSYSEISEVEIVEVTVYDEISSNNDAVPVENLDELKQAIREMF